MVAMYKTGSGVYEMCGPETTLCVSHVLCIVCLPVCHITKCCVCI